MITKQQLDELVDLEYLASLFDTCSCGEAKTEAKFREYEEESNRLHGIFWQALADAGISLEDYRVLVARHFPQPPTPYRTPLKTIPF